MRARGGRFGDLLTWTTWRSAASSGGGSSSVLQASVNRFGPVRMLPRQVISPLGHEVDGSAFAASAFPFARPLGRLRLDATIAADHGHVAKRRVRQPKDAISEKVQVEIAIHAEQYAASVHRVGLRAAAPAFTSTTCSSRLHPKRR